MKEFFYRLIIKGGELLKYRKQKKLFIKDIIQRFYKINLNNDDIVVLEYPYGEVKAKEISHVFHYVKRIIGKKNRLIALPNSLSFMNMSIEELSHINKTIDILLDKLKEKNESEVTN